MGLSLLPHLPALWAGFSADDAAFYTQNASIRSLAAIPSFFGLPFPPNDPERGLYRPLTNASYAVDHALFGDRAAGVHLTNLVLYAITLVAVARFLRRRLGHGGVALGATLVFGMHPVHCEVVDSVAGRSELLGLLFSVLALNLLHREAGVGSAGRVALAWGAFVAGTFAKESAVVLPAVLLLDGLLRAADREARGRALRAAVPFFGWVPAYLAIRAGALGQLTPSGTALGGETIGTWLSTVGAVAAEYARLLVAPGVLQIDYYYSQVHPGILHAPTIQSVAGWLLVAAWLVGFVGATRRAWRDGPGILASVAIGLGLLGAFLFPVSHVIPFGALLAERFLYAPSLGFVLAVGAAVEWRFARAPDPAPLARLLRVGLAVVVAAFGIRTALRAHEWRSTATIWAPLLAMRPDEPRLLNNVASGYLESGEFEAALPYLTRAIELDPTDAKSVQNRAWLRLQTGDLAGAESDYRLALSLNPESAVVLNGLGQVCNRDLRHTEALGYYERALRINPNYAAAVDNAAMTRVAIGRARAWLDAHPDARRAGASPADRVTLAQACRVVAENPCRMDPPAPEAGAPLAPTPSSPSPP